MDRTMVRTPLIFAMICACAQEAPRQDIGTSALLDAGISSPIDGGSDAVDGGIDVAVPFPSCEGCKPTACDQQSDCSEGERCLVSGRCAVGDCWNHGDCEADQRCFQNQCLSRPTAEHGILFERRFAEPFASHHGYETNGYGIGLALLDFDRDGDLDLYLASNQLDGNGSPACLYENQSTPGTTRLRAVERLCQPHDTFLEERSNASAIDLEGDGFHELLIMGKGTVILERFYPVEERINLLRKLPRSDRRGYCFAGAALAHDFNYDGRIDLYIGCQTEARTERNPEMRENILFLQTQDGQLEPEPRENWYLLNDEGSSLGLGAIDFNNDGLLDIPVMNDTFTLRGSIQIAYDLNPGSILWRCSPLSDLCVFNSQRFARGDDAWGSFMGLGHLHVEGVGDHLFISEWGANRLVRFEDQRPVDYSADARVQIGIHNGTWIYSWGVIVDDWNRDGREDLFVSQGIVPVPGDIGGADHQDTILIQGESARFTSYSEELGIAMPSHVDSLSDAVVHSSRSAVKLDLDYDGFADIVTAPNEGLFLHHAEVPIRPAVSPRCTLIPRPRVVPTFGTGYGVLPEGETRYRNWDVQGQLFMNTSPWIFTPFGRGEFRFPSGAIVPYDCLGGAGPVEIVEPDWINVQFESEQARIRLTAPWLGDAPQLLAAYQTGPTGPHEGQPVRDGDDWILPFSTQGAFMLQLNDRWLPLWFEP